MRTRVYFFLIFTVFLSSCTPDSTKRNENTILIFAASSTASLLNHITAQYKEDTGKVVIPSYASSSTLAKQIAQGSPADLFLSANTHWITYLEKQNSVDTSSKVAIFENTLSLVSHPSHSIEESKDIHSYLQKTQSKLIIADPEHVPLGFYTSEALKNYGLWDLVQNNTARMSEARMVSRIIEQKQAIYGITYSSEAYNNPNLKVLTKIPNDKHSDIQYCLIKTNHCDSSAQEFYQYLISDAIRSDIRDFGFQTIDSIQE